ncbi:hypothetical protein ACIPW9_36355 [Streptomyces sp. NPDC090052]|uniref:hypothetical protein n=1 Tax=Streptomyces sp. NPDC090052 TaxID=3365931 RepID=UPI003805F78E
MDEISLDRAAAQTVHYTDPRVRQLAEARWRLKEGGTREDWLQLGKANPEALIEEARDWVRAAVGAGILPPPEPNPMFAEFDRMRVAKNANQKDT